jgi:DNA-binding NarL/FixJ family response regulator
VIRVAIADDHTLVRAGFHVLLDAEAGVDVVGVASDGRQAVELARSQRPDVLLMDIRMPEIDGIEATRRIAGDPGLAHVRVLILTTFELDEYVVDALRAGASGFLLKDIQPLELIRAVEVVAAGDALLAPSITRRLIGQLVDRPGTPVPPGPALDVLTDREREVLALVGRGLSNQEIAAQLFISVATARTHVSRAMTKLHARDRAQLVVTAYESRLVTPGQTPDQPPRPGSAASSRPARN